MGEIYKPVVGVIVAELAFKILISVELVKDVVFKTPVLMADVGILLKFVPVNVGAVPDLIKVDAKRESEIEPSVKVACFPLICVCKLLNVVGNASVKLSV